MFCILGHAACADIKERPSTKGSQRSKLEPAITCRVYCFLQIGIRHEHAVGACCMDEMDMAMLRVRRTEVPGLCQPVGMQLTSDLPMQRVNVLQFRRELEQAAEEHQVVTYDQLLDHCQKRCFALLCLSIIT